MSFGLKKLAEFFLDQMFAIAAIFTLHISLQGHEHNLPKTNSEVLLLIRGEPN